MNKFLIRFCLVYAFCIPSIFSDPLKSWLDLGNYTSKRISSYDRSEANEDFINLPPSSSTTIAEIDGAGIIKHIWFTFHSSDKMIRRNLVMKIYWDGFSSPSVDVPVGDFFGQGWAEEYTMNSLPLVAAPKKGKGLNSYFPMPFSSKAKIVIVNESSESVPSFYYYIDYEEHVSIPENTPRFYSVWTRKLTEPEPSDDMENDLRVFGPPIPGKKSLSDHFVFLNTKGSGHFVGLNLYIDSPTPLWYGEGDDLFFIDQDDGDWPPTLHGTGTEDLFNTAWSPKELFMHPYFGYPRVNDQIGHLGRTHLYRFWVESPIRFRKSIIGALEHGHANALSLDMVGVAYYYQNLPLVQVASLLPKEKRQNMQEISPKDIHRWRGSFREKRKNKWIWGTEQ
jgi:hypothetical protein